MSTNASRHPMESGRRPVLPVLAVLVAIALLPGAAPAQEDTEGLAAQLREQFRVLPLSDGVVLEPRDPDTGVAVIEVREDRVAVDGSEVTQDQLEELLGEDTAALVLRLEDLSPSELTALLAPAVAPAPPAAPLDESPPAPPAPTPTPDPAPAPGAVPPAAPPPAPDPPTGRADDRVVMGGNVHIVEGERVNEVVVFGGTVQMDGEAIGDVTVVGGAATVNGPVGGDVTLIGGSLGLGPRARVEGDLSVVGGSLDRHPDAVVHGEVVQSIPSALNWNPFGGDRRDRHADGESMGDDWDAMSPFRRVVGATFSKIAVLMLIAMLAMLIVLLARRPLVRTAERIRREPAKSGLVGLAIEILILPITVAVVVLLAVSIIGIPLLLLVPFALIGTVLVAFFGFCAAAYRVGDWMQERFSWEMRDPYLIVLFGIAILGSLGIVGALLHFGWLNIFAGMLILLGALAGYLAWTIGLGAALLEWHASRREPPAVMTQPPDVPEPIEGA